MLNFMFPVPCGIYFCSESVKLIIYQPKHLY